MSEQPPKWATGIVKPLEWKPLERRHGWFATAPIYPHGHYFAYSDDEKATAENAYIILALQAIDIDAIQARLAAAENMAEALERAALAFNAAHLIVLCEGTPTLEALHEEMSAARAAHAAWEAAR
jgi:hypothetical protein